MREIKFRAWGGVLKEIIPWKVMCANLWLFLSGKYASEYELMQYTGLLDKNGKEIYEGDILREDNRNLWEIVWYKTGLQMRHIPLGEVWFTLQESCELGILEVIGNIWENPELLFEKANEE